MHGVDARTAAEGPSASPYPPAARARAAKAEVGAPDAPSAWRPPVEAHMPTRARTRLVTGARDGTDDQRMSEAGCAARKPAADLPRVGGRTPTDRWYGIHDAALAAGRGHHPDVDEPKSYGAAVQEAAVKQTVAEATAT
ncbi:hypothetical protein [Streptomyces sp. NK15101]|uniref:hypothetical protein n=1 Tax=Streptomyces sp. NK15101 TaxID=2873261 RepID=UPI001CEC5156|nr:hypothetical protein [Streptomyces sp. NK15101]